MPTALSLWKPFSLGFCDSIVSLQVPSQSPCCLLSRSPSPGDGESFIHSSYLFYPLQDRPLMNSKPIYSRLLGISVPPPHKHLDSDVHSRGWPLHPPRMVVPQSSASKKEAPNHSDSQSSLIPSCSCTQDRSSQRQLPNVQVSTPSPLQMLPAWRTSGASHPVSLPLVLPPQCIRHSKLGVLFKANSR